DRAVPARYVFFDGSTDVSSSVLRARGKLAEDGVVVVTVGVELRDSTVVFGPEVDLHGVVADDEVAEVAKAIVGEVRSAIEANTKSVSLRQVQDLTRQAARKVIRERTERKPVVLPAIIEV